MWVWVFVLFFCFFAKQRHSLTIYFVTGVLRREKEASAEKAALAFGSRGERKPQCLGINWLLGFSKQDSAAEDYPQHLNHCLEEAHHRNHNLVPEGTAMEKSSFILVSNLYLQLEFLGPLVQTRVCFFNGNIQ